MNRPLRSFKDIKRNAAVRGLENHSFYCFRKNPDWWYV